MANILNSLVRGSVCKFAILIVGAYLAFTPFSFARAANEPYLVKDLKYDLPYTLTGFKGKVYFFRQGADRHGFELWSSDGSAQGTLKLKKISHDEFDPPFRAVVVNGKMYFVGNDGVHGDELWKSDGTFAGTAMVRDIAVPGGALVSSLTRARDRLYFFANDGTHGQELWTSDGTAGGTIMPRDVNPVVRQGGYATGRWLTAAKRSVYFAANDQVHGIELWTSDGTTDGTRLVKDISSAGGSRPTNLVFAQATLYFVANQDELWRTDGTELGTVMIHKFASPIGGLVKANGIIFFRLGTQLWKTDGTPDGTMMVKEIGSGGPMVNVQGTLFLTNADAEHGAELWKSDGTPEGTVLVRDIHPTGSSAPACLTALKGKLFFDAEDGTHGSQLWQSDGSPEGTFMVSTGGSHKRHSTACGAVNVRGTVWFRVWNIKNSFVYTHELWAYKP